MAHGALDAAGSGVCSGGAGNEPEQPLQALRGAGARSGSHRVRARQALMSASAGPFAEDLASDTESGSSEEDASGSDEDVAAWISWFVSLRGNEFFCEVDEDFIQDDFNLSGLSSQVQGPIPHAHACLRRPALACAWCMTCGATILCSGCLSAPGQPQGVGCIVCRLSCSQPGGGWARAQALRTR